MAAGDLFWNDVYVAMHMDDAGLTDVKANALTLSGGVTRSATHSKFGGFSAYFDGVDDEITNVDALPQIYSDWKSHQFFCRPETQVMANPCVLDVYSIKIEYKPTGCPNGFAINHNGVRTACGEQPEGAWYFIWLAIEVDTFKVYINGNLITTLPYAGYVDSGYFFIGSSSLAINTDSAFKGYVDDLLMTGDVLESIQGHLGRWDYSVPTVAFYENLPDPEGTGAGSLQFTGLGSVIVVPFGTGEGSLTFGGTGVGIVAPIGIGQGSLRFTGLGEGSIPCAGSASGSIRFTGASAGVVGIVGIGSGSLRFTGHGVGALGSFGVGHGSIRFKGSAAGAHGVSGIGAGALRFEGLAVGTTPIVPIGIGSGSLRFTGNGYGIGGVVDRPCH